MSNYECRKKARNILKGRYAEGFFVVMICIAVYFIFKLLDIAKILIMLYNNIEISELYETADILYIPLKYISGIVLFIIMTPLVTGGLWWFYQMAGGNDNRNILKLYTGFKLNFRASLVYILMWGITFLSLLPSVSCLAAAFYFFEIVPVFHNQALVLFICIQLFAAGIFLTGLYLKAVCTVILSPFIFLKNPDMNAFSIINSSRKKIYGYKLECLKLIMTYIPAMLPIVTIPFVLPKAIMSFSVFAYDRIGD